MLQLVHHQRLHASFFADLAHCRIFAQLALHLLVILHVQRILRLQLGEFLVDAGGFFQLPALHAGVRQRLIDLVHAGVFAGFDEDAAQHFQRRCVVGELVHRSDQLLDHRRGAAGQQFVVILVVDLQRWFHLAGGQHCLGIAREPAGVVVLIHQLVGDLVGFIQPVLLDVRHHQRAQRIRARVQIGQIFQLLHRLRAIA